MHHGLQRRRDKIHRALPAPLSGAGCTGSGAGMALVAEYQQVLTHMVEQGCQESLNLRVVHSDWGIVSFSQSNIGELVRQVPKFSKGPEIGGRRAFCTRDRDHS
jgi:hypothetical protein